MKKQIRNLAVRAISVMAPAVWRFARGRRLVVLMYHRVLPVNHPDCATEQPGMFVTPATLRMNLRTVSELGLQFVHLDDWLHAEESGSPLPRLACAVTFDDGWRDNYDHAFNVLKEERAPATIYLVSDLVGTDGSLWPYRLGQLLGSVGSAAFSEAPTWLRDRVAEVALAPGRRFLQPQIDAVIDFCKTRSDLEMQNIVQDCDKRSGCAAPARTLMNWSEVREMAGSGLVRFGSHTRTHSRLSGLSDTERVKEEVAGSAAGITRHLGLAPRSFCFPNGDVTEPSLDVVRSVYGGAVTTVRGWHAAGRDPYRIPRIGVHDDIGRQRPAFVARLSGCL